MSKNQESRENVQKAGNRLVSMSPFNCFYHPNLPAVAVCSRCGRGTCASCSKPYGALTLCPNCFHTIPPPQMAPGMVPGIAPGMVPGIAPGMVPGIAPGMVTAYPPRGARPGWYGPFPFNFLRSQWVPITLVGIAAVLIIMNGVARRRASLARQGRRPRRSACRIPSIRSRGHGGARQTAQ